MEIADNGIMMAVPGAIDAGLADPLFWTALGVSLVVAFAFAYPLNRYLIARGQGHAVVHPTTGTVRPATTRHPVELALELRAHRPRGRCDDPRRHRRRGHAPLAR